MQILIVEDNEQLRLTLKDLFEEYGLSVVALDSVETAKLWLLFNEPIAVLTDFQLKEENGLDLVAHLRDGGYSRDIFLMSGCLLERHAQTMAKYNVNFYLKPQDVSRLIEDIVRLAGPLPIEEIDEKLAICP